MRGRGKVRPVLGNTAPAYLTGGLSELELGHELGLSSSGRKTVGCPALVGI